MTPQNGIVCRIEQLELVIVEWSKSLEDPRVRYDG